jgi:cellulose synthase/poly-beta-1,6-N-acetylglucosamine synthase-like glycosyltransferase
VIGALVDSIAAADYPDGLLDIFVIVNNCSDRTREIALEHGARVIDCITETRCKADVLNIAFDELAGRTDIDAYAVFDADNLVDPGFFREAGRALQAGYDYVQGRRTGKNTGATWIAGCYEIYYAMQNSFFNHPRSLTKLSASINGTGWAVMSDVIKQFGFDMQTIVEDHETNRQSAAAGYRIAYCHDALVYDEFTENTKESFTQRIRWTYGMIQCMRQYEGRLLRQAFRGSLQCFDIAMVNIMPAVIPASLLGMVSGFFIAEPAMGYPMLAVWMLCIGWTGFMLGALIALAKSGSRISACVPGIAGFPLFMLSWIAVFVICLFKKDISWTPVRHTRAITIEEVDPAINKRD